MPTPNTTKEVEDVVDKLTSILFVEGYVEKQNLEQVNFLLTQSITTLTAKHEALDPVRVGMLRQWINEDRIINNPNKKLITNEDIVFWLTPTKTNKQ